jgi:hypothetical protein
MRSWPQHAAFAVIFIGTLAVHASGRPDVLTQSAPIEPTVIRVGQLQGLAFRGFARLGDTAVPELVFDAPGCTHRMFVTVLGTAFEQEASVGMPPSAGYLRRYFYIDRTWKQPDHLAIIAERIRWAVLATFGLGRYQPLRQFLIVDIPSGCQAAMRIDWRPVWASVFLKPAQNNTKDNMRPLRP